MCGRPSNLRETKVFNQIGRHLTIAVTCLSVSLIASSTAAARPSSGATPRLASDQQPTNQSPPSTSQPARVDSVLDDLILGRAGLRAKKLEDAARAAEEEARLGGYYDPDLPDPPEEWTLSEEEVWLKWQEVLRLKEEARRARYEYEQLQREQDRRETERAGSGSQQAPQTPATPPPAGTPQTPGAPQPAGPPPAPPGSSPSTPPPQEQSQPPKQSELSDEEEWWINWSLWWLEWMVGMRILPPTVREQLDNPGVDVDPGLLENPTIPSLAPDKPDDPDEPFDPEPPGTPRRESSTAPSDAPPGGDWSPLGPNMIPISSTSPLSTVFQTMGIEGVQWDESEADAREFGGRFAWPSGIRSSLRAVMAAWFRLPALNTDDVTGNVRVGWSSRHLANRRVPDRDVVDLDTLRREQGGGLGDLVVSIVATGNTSGEAFQLQVVNRSGVKRKLFAPDGLALQPLKEGLKNPLQSVAGNLVRKHPILGYCLEFLKLPPKPGTLYRIADQAVQERFKPVARILNATRELARTGGLHPDTDIGAYLTSIKQYAIWTKLEGWNEPKFGQAFLAKTKQNVQALGRPWTKQVEETIKKAIPGRWRDITAVLQAASRQ